MYADGYGSRILANDLSFCAGDVQDRFFSGWYGEGEFPVSSIRVGEVFWIDV